MFSKIVVAALAVLGGFAFTINHAGAASADTSAATQCKSLEAADFSKIKDAPTRVTAANIVAPRPNVAGYCEVHGDVTPKIGFLLRLPIDRWNGKLLELGCGGPCGQPEYTAAIAACGDPMRRGYACIVPDGGHTVNESAPMKWAADDPQAAIRYFVRASHVAALAGKGIVQSYYGHELNKSYFMGCSAGGIQAMWEAQKFPWDFDGIIAGGPALRLSDIWMSWLWNNRALTGTDGTPIFGHRDLELLHRAIVAKCDLNDGIKDGLIGDPRQCKLDPAELQCTTSKTRDCLTPQQVDAAKKIYEGPVTSNGEQIATPIALKGSERTWLDMYTGSESKPNPLYNYFKYWFRYSVFPIDLGPAWKPADFDFDRDSQRIGAMEALEPHDADLRRFKAAGRKLLVYTGASDSIEGVLNTTAYYETAERIVGGRSATQDFFRLFVVPGMYHCGGGDGPFAIDYLSYLEAWVEKGLAPAVVIGARPKSDDYADWSKFPLDPSAVGFTRPIYPYPLSAKYKGSGDPNNSESFKPVAR